MNQNEITKKTNIIPFMDKHGKILHEISLPENVIPIISKRTAVSDKGIYYKGAGTIYTCHFANEIDENAKMICKTGIIYEQYKVTYLNLCGKYGIFDFPHQPMFTDREGGCGPKEKNLLNMQKRFAYSAISEIVDVLDTGIPDHNIYAYKLKDARGSLSDTCNLIEYFLNNNFCTAWDKNLWSDIYCFQYVRDVGDWYISDSIAAKLGTIYALLHSLYETDLYLYLELQRLLLGEMNIEKHFLIYYSARVVVKFCPKEWEETHIDLNKVTSKLFKELLSMIVGAKACCHLENEDKWSWTRMKLLDKLNSYEKQIQISLINCL